MVGALGLFTQADRRKLPDESEEVTGIAKMAERTKWCGLYFRPIAAELPGAFLQPARWTRFHVCLPESTS